ncbi:hypothetical protein WDW89_03660 [Deltaproteobacteria bacterium TL4]
MRVLSFLLVFIVSGGMNSLYADSEDARQATEKVVESTKDLKEDSSLIIKGNIQTLYKNQTNFATPLDASGTFHGANNRASQTVRARSALNFIMLGGKQRSYGEDWYQFIGAAGVKLDANDPDDRDNAPAFGSGDPGGKPKNLIKAGALWVRYSPILPVGITVGTHSLESSTILGNTYVFEGDFEDNFQGPRAVSAIDGLPGISVDVNFSKDTQVGLGLFKGAGTGSELIATLNVDEASDQVLWFKTKVGLASFAMAHQTVASGGREDTKGDVPIPSVFQFEYKHTVLNFSVLLDFDKFKPYLGYQSFQGDKAEIIMPSGDINSARNELLAGLIGSGIPAAQAEAMIAGIKPLQVTENESRVMNSIFISVGFSYNFGNAGEFAIDYTQHDTPKFGEEGTATLIRGLESTLMTNYSIPINKDSKITFFYHTLSAREDDTLSADAKQAQANAAAAAALSPELADA